MAKARVPIVGGSWDGETVEVRSRLIELPRREPLPYKQVAPAIERKEAYALYTHHFYREGDVAHETVCFYALASMGQAEAFRALLAGYRPIRKGEYDVVH